MKAIFQKNNSLYPLHFYIDYNNYIIEVVLDNSLESKFLAIDKNTKLALFESHFFDISYIATLKREIHEIDERLLPISFFTEIEDDYIINQFEFTLKQLNNFINKKYIPYDCKINVFHYYTLLYKNKKITEEEYNVTIPFFVTNTKDNKINYIYHKPIENNIEKTDFLNHINFSLNNYNNVMLCTRYNPYMLINNLEKLKEYIDKDYIFFFFNNYKFDDIHLLNKQEFKYIFKYMIEFIKENNIEYIDDKHFLIFFSQIYFLNMFKKEELSLKKDLFHLFLKDILMIKLSEYSLNNLIDLYLKNNKEMVFNIRNPKLFMNQPNLINVIFKWKDKKLVFKQMNKLFWMNYEFSILFEAYSNNVISEKKLHTIIEKLEPLKCNDLKLNLEKYLLIDNLKNF